jgi:signal transduction histidine kinase
MGSLTNLLGHPTPSSHPGGPDEGTVIVAADGSVVLCNPVAERILGVSLEDLLGRGPGTGLLIRLLKRADGASAAAAAAGEPSSFATLARGPERTAVNLERADGSTVGLEVRTRPVGPRAPGALGAVAVAFRELRPAPPGEPPPTAHDDAGCTELVWELDALRGEASFEPQLARLGLVPLAVPAEWWALFAPEDREAMTRAWRAHADGVTGLAEMQGRARTLEGGWRWVLGRARILTRGDDGRPAWVVGTLSDISRQKALESQLSATERLASIGTLAAGVAHEINNPLAWISANLGFVLEHLGEGDAEPEELKRSLREALDGVARVADIVRRLRVFGRPTLVEGGRTRVKVAEELEVALSMSRHDVSHRARLVLDAPEPLPEVLMAPHELAQVLVNLLRNAAQAIPEGRAHANEVRVQVRSFNGELALEVRDTGSGIAPEVRPRIFDPFFTTRPQGEGTGLGLSVCHGIVAAAKGRIEVESELGRGSVFRVVLPAFTSPRTPVTAPGLRGPRRRVLVVDDEPMVGRAVIRMLSDSHDVSAVTSAAQALARLEGGERYHLVLCDLMMPDTTGMDFARQLEAASPPMAARLVFMTGGAFTPAAQHFIESQGLPPLLKPLDAKVLLARIAAMPELE